MLGVMFTPWRKDPYFSRRERFVWCLLFWVVWANVLIQIAGIWF